MNADQDAMNELSQQIIEKAEREIEKWVALFSITPNESIARANNEAQKAPEAAANPEIQPSEKEYLENRAHEFQKVAEYLEKSLSARTSGDLTLATTYRKRAETYERSLYWQEVVKDLLPDQLTLLEIRAERNHWLQKVGIAEVQELEELPCDNSIVAKKARAEEVMAVIKEKVWPPLSEAMKNFIKIPSPITLAIAHQAALTTLCPMATLAASAADGEDATHAKAAAKITAKTTKSFFDKYRNKSWAEEDAKATLDWSAKKASEVALFAEAMRAYKRGKKISNSTKDSLFTGDSLQTVKTALAEINRLATTPIDVDDWRPLYTKSEKVRKELKEKIWPVLLREMADFRDDPSEERIAKISKIAYASAYASAYACDYDYASDYDAGFDVSSYIYAYSYTYAYTYASAYAYASAGSYTYSYADSYDSISVSALLASLASPVSEAEAASAAAEKCATVWKYSRYLIDQKKEDLDWAVTIARKSAEFAQVVAAFRARPNGIRTTL